MSTEEQRTEMYETPKWEDPVTAVSDLPATSEEGTMCFVETERTVYVYVNGEWKSRANRPQ